MFPSWFRHLSDDERIACRLIWRWKSVGKQHAEVPDIGVETLRRLYHALSVLEGKYSVAIAKAQKVLAELEDLEDDKAREGSDGVERALSESLDDLRSTVGVVEELIMMRGKAQVRA